VVMEKGGGLYRRQAASILDPRQARSMRASEILAGDVAGNVSTFFCCRCVAVLFAKAAKRGKF